MPRRSQNTAPEVQASATTNEPPSSFNLVIYQNSDFVAGLLQQLLGKGLPIQEILDAVTDISQKDSIDGSGSASGGANLTFPGTNWGLKADASGNLNASTTNDSRSENRSSQTWQFTQANYLHTVRQQLATKNLVKTITTPASLEAMTPGDFVEFSATFEPNEVNSILDLATPGIVSAIVKHQHRKKAISGFNFSEGGHEAREAFAFKMNLEMESKAEIAAATTEAVRQDFRNETTREFFGKVISAEGGRRVTAVTICDIEHFSGKDKDRILDGNFRVLGKVTEITNSRYPILSRNKVLNRIRKPLLDEFEATMLNNETNEQFNTAFKLFVDPPVVKIIPIAIYI